jgi:hypothetical protein
MHTTVTTTITTQIDLDTFTPDHRVSVEVEDDLPPEIVASAAIGGCKATIKSLQAKYPRLRQGDAEEDEGDAERVPDEHAPGAGPRLPRPR